MKKPWQLYLSSFSKKIHLILIIILSLTILEVSSQGTEIVGTYEWSIDVFEEGGVKKLNFEELHGRLEIIKSTEQLTMLIHYKEDTIKVSKNYMTNTDYDIILIDKASVFWKGESEINTWYLRELFENALFSFHLYEYKDQKDALRLNILNQLQQAKYFVRKFDKSRDEAYIFFEINDLKTIKVNAKFKNEMKGRINNNSEKKLFFESYFEFYRLTSCFLFAPKGFIKIIKS